MITPFTDNNEIDYDGVLEILDFYSKAGVDGIFAICQSSEIFFLSFEERLSLLKFIMENKPEGMSIVASGHTADDIETQLKEAKAFIETGIDAYVLISNRLAKEDEGDEVFLENFKKFVAAFPGTDFGVYECPYPYKRVMMPETLKKCCAAGPLKFIKDTCCDIELIKEKLEAVKGTGLKIYNANAATLLESLNAGCAGYSGVMANFHPDLYKQLCALYKTNPGKAKVISDFISFSSTIELQQYPVNAKYHLTLEGLNIGVHTRSRDASNFTDANKKEIQAMKSVENSFRNFVKSI